MQKIRGFVLTCIRDGQRLGEVRDDLDATTLAVITHRLPLSDAPHGFSLFRDKQDECMKVVLKAS
ncbi:MAG: hypothetical protein U0326_20280 [Polyangiales bacterium]